MTQAAYLSPRARAYLAQVCATCTPGSAGMGVLESVANRTMADASMSNSSMAGPASGMGRDESIAWGGISDSAMSDASMAGPVAGMGDFGSSIPYLASLGIQPDLASPTGGGIVQAANDGNVAQAQQLYGQLSNMLNNDVANSIISDQTSLQLAFANAANLVAAATANQAANQAAWQALVNAMVARSNALNSDIGYVSSQGNVASTVAGQQADASMGGAANSLGGGLNVVMGGPGGSSVVNASNIPSALRQALGPGGTLQNPVTDFLSSYRWGIVAAGGLLALGVGVLAWSLYGPRRRSNPGRARRAPPPPRRAPSRAGARRAPRLIARAA